LLSKLKPDINNAISIENEDEDGEKAGSMVVDESSEDIEMENGSQTKIVIMKSL
jgi:hypothetical protein